MATKGKTDDCRMIVAVILACTTLWWKNRPPLRVCITSFDLGARRAYCTFCTGITGASRTTGNQFFETVIFSLIIFGIVVPMLPKRSNFSDKESMFSTLLSEPFLLPSRYDLNCWLLTFKLGMKPHLTIVSHRRPNATLSYKLSRDLQFPKRKSVDQFKYFAPDLICITTNGRVSLTCLVYLSTNILEPYLNYFY